MSELSVSRLRVHSLSESAWKDIPGIEAYETRSLIVSGPDDVVVTSRPVNPDFANYLSETLGMGPREVFVAEGVGENLTQRILNDASLLERLRDLSGNGIILDTFTVTENEELLANAIDKPVLGDAATVRRLGSKSGFRTQARKLGINLAPGFEGLESLKDIFISVRSLFHAGYECVVVKGDWGSSSTQNLLLHKDIEWERLLLNQYPDLNICSAVVEVWLPDCVSSPCLHYYANGTVRALPGPWLQILEDENCGAVGATFPMTLDAGVTQQIKVQGQALAERYHAQGARGHFGYDLVLLKDGRIVWVECNLRKGGAYYIRKFAEMHKLLDKVIWGQDFAHKQLERIPFRVLRERFQNILYTPENGRGLVFYTPDLMRFGKIQVIVIGNTQKEVSGYWTQLKYMFRQHIL